MKSYDVIIIGSGIGGLCCGSILALAGKKVLISEAHSQPGGVAHSFNRKVTSLNLVLHYGVVLANGLRQTL